MSYVDMLFLAYIMSNSAHTTRNFSMYLKHLRPYQLTDAAAQGHPLLVAGRLH